MKLFAHLFVIVALSTLVSASIVNETMSGFNSKTYGQNYQDLLYAASDSYGTVVQFNHTQLFSGGDCGAGKTCMWVPWYSSSSASGPAQLKTYGSCTGSNMSKNVMVTDEFSEVVVVLSALNASGESLFNASMNTIEALPLIGANAAPIPGWVYCRDSSTLSNPDSNGASDATHRLVMALYTAGANVHFSNATRTRAISLASGLMNTSISSDTKRTTAKNTTIYQNLNYWLFAGKNQATNGFSSNTAQDQYVGYWQDATTACMMHAKMNPSNTTIVNICANWTAQALAMVNYVGTGLTHGYYRTAYDQSTGKVVANCSSGYTTYCSGVESWDDADAPRFWGFCYTWLAANWSGLYTMSAQPWSNLTDYCGYWEAAHGTSWSTSGSSTSSFCQQYKADGTCQSGKGPFNSAKLAGMAYPSVEMFDAAKASIVLNNTNSHYSWSTGKIDSGTGAFSYDNVRFPKALWYALGYPSAVIGGPNPWGNYTPPAGGYCGDGNIDVGETCDNGGSNGVCPAACSSSCTTNVCSSGNSSSLKLGVCSIALGNGVLFFG